MIRLLVLTLFCIALARPSLAQTPATWINPLDIDYKYNFEQAHEGISYRTGADPVVVPHGGDYFLFLTLADGYWRSQDLIHWDFLAPSRWPFDGNVAPAAISLGDKLYLMQSSMEPRPLLSSTDPASGVFEFEVRAMAPLPNAVGPNRESEMQPGQIPPGPWDPALFRDDDGRWYLYWNSSNEFPIYGIELDAAHGFAYVGQATPLIALDPARHGWERFGRDHRDEATKPFIEGAWMTKRGGNYYLQYGAPGTEYNAYANGVYVSEHPLGPFIYAPYNPISYKPGGFVIGAGHGSTFQDEYGNWWNTGTPWVAVNWNFERRVAMFPAGFERDGQMYASTRFGDFPHWAPQGAWRSSEELFTGWMLLSYRKTASASSTLADFAAANVTDENPQTFWVAQENKPGETLTLDLGGARTVRAVQVNFADYQSARFGDAPDIYTAFRLSSSLDGESWSPLAEVKAEEHRDRPNAYLPLPEPVQARFIRYEHGHVGAAHLAISDLRVFGAAEGRAPATPRGLTATRRSDARNAEIRWSPVPGAVGYNIRWGVRADRLHQTYQVWADAAQSLELRALTIGQDYWVAIEAFDEVGVSRLSRAVRLNAD